MSHSQDNLNLFQNLCLELRRGSLILAVLACLRFEQYGYTPRKALADRGLDIEEGTLYPPPPRLQTQGLLLSEWGEAEKAKKRFFWPSPLGEKNLAKIFSQRKT